MSIDEAADSIVEGPGDPGGDAGVGVDDFRDEPVPGQGAFQTEIAGLAEQKGDAFAAEPVFIPTEGVETVLQAEKISLFHPKAELIVKNLMTR